MVLVSQVKRVTFISPNSYFLDNTLKIEFVTHMVRRILWLLFLKRKTKLSIKNKIEYYRNERLLIV